MYGLSVALPEELVKSNLDVILDTMLDLTNSSGRATLNPYISVVVDNFSFGLS